MSIKDGLKRQENPKRGLRAEKESVTRYEPAARRDRGVGHPALRRLVHMGQGMARRAMVRVAVTLTLRDLIFVNAGITAGWACAAFPMLDDRSIAWEGMAIGCLVTTFVFLCRRISEVP